MYQNLSNVHHKDVKRTSDHLVEWLSSHLACMGVFECGFVYTNFQSGQFICLNSNVTWRYQFLEKDLDYDLPDLDYLFFYQDQVSMTNVIYLKKDGIKNRKKVVCRE